LRGNSILKDKSKQIFKKENSKVQLMTQTREPVEVKRKISYVEQDQAFTQIRLGREELLEYSFLKTKENGHDFFLITKIHRKFQELKEEIERLEKLGIMPMISFINRYTLWSCHRARASSKY